MTELVEVVEVVNAEVCDVEELCEIEDNAIKLLFNDDVDWRDLVEESLDDVNVFEDEDTLECWVKLELETLGANDSEEECLLEDCRLDVELERLEAEELEVCLTIVLVGLEMEGDVLWDLMGELFGRLAEVRLEDEYRDEKTLLWSVSEEVAWLEVAPTPTQSNATKSWMSTSMNNMFLIIRMRVLEAFKKISMQELSLLIYHV
jgi:hypothetical protein